MKKAAILAAALALGATPALANKADKQAKVDHYFNRIDTNKDGFISEAEQNAFSATKFQEADTNKDGRLSKDEVHAHKVKEKSMYKDSKGSEDTGDYKDNSQGNR